LFGANKWKPSFRIHNQETAIVLILSPEVLELLGNQLPVTAEWEHIMKLYEFDNARQFHLLFKLTLLHKM
jgi:hypothetical protein